MSYYFWQIDNERYKLKRLIQIPREWLLSDLCCLFFMMIQILFFDEAFHLLQYEML